MDMDVDIVPMRELAADRLAADGIVRHQVLDRLVREDDAPAERVVGPVALEHMDIMARIAHLHRDGEIKARRPAAHACDLHRAELPRGDSVRVT